MDGAIGYSVSSGRETKMGNSQTQEGVPSFASSQFTLEFFTGI